MQNQQHRIWQPSVEPKQNETPNQASSNTSYTTTCLRAQTDSRIEQLNKEIRNVSQSYNSTARSFSEFKKKGDNMAPPKLVHQQYNSPMQLYSMDNIKKSIEAHSEVIAPGVKGINFMKSKEPVNKQSEVYKLVMEEEERRQKTPSRQHPQPQNSPGLATGAVQHKQQQQQCVHFAMQQDEHACHDHEQASQTIGDKPKCCECGQAILGPFAKLQDRFIHAHCFNCSTCGTSLKNSGYFTINEKLYCDIHARQVANVMRSNFNFEPNKLSHQPAPIPVTISGREQRDVTLQRSRSTSSLFDVKRSLSPSSMPAIQVNEQRKQTGDWQHYLNVKSNHSASCQCCKASYAPTTANNNTTISSMFTNAHCSASDRHCCSCSCHNLSSGKQSEIKWTWRPASNSQPESTSTSVAAKLHKEHELSTQSNLTRVLNSSSKTSTQQQQQQHHQAIHHYSGAQHNNSNNPTNRLPVCQQCHITIHGPYILAGQSIWCKPCSLTRFVCSSCNRSLLNCGFIESPSSSQRGINHHEYNCETCYENHLAPICSKCSLRIKGDCLNALGKQWHPLCFVCGHCRQPFGNSSFYLEDNVPYCQRDWNLLFTIKCFSCSFPISAGDKWIEALGKNYHADCFRCSSCWLKLEGSTFLCKAGKPYCRMHATK